MRNRVKQTYKCLCSLILLYISDSFSYLQYISNLKYNITYKYSRSGKNAPQITSANKIAYFWLYKPQKISKYNAQTFKNENAFCDRLEFNLMSLHLDPNNIEESHNIIVSTLAEAYETIPKVSR